MEEQVIQETTQVESPVEAPKANLIENNLVAMRKKLEAEEKARKDLENRLAQAERNAAQYKAPVEDDEEDENVKRVRFLEERLNKMEVESVTTKLANFSELVTDDNLATLQRLYPDEYEGLRYNPDVKSRAKMAYNMIKNYGIATTASKSNNEKIEENKKKPTAASLGAPQSPATPLSRLDEYGRRRLTDEDRERVMKEVAKKRKAS